MVNYLIRVFVRLGIFLVCTWTVFYFMTFLLVGLVFESPRWWKVATGIDQTGNASVGGSEDETLSSRAARAMDRGDKWGCVLCKLLDYVQKDHCKKSLGI